MAYVSPSTPNLADFITFCRGQGVVAAVLAADAPDFQWSFDFAVDRCPCAPGMPAGPYVNACYNLGLHSLIEMAQDQTGLGITALAWGNGLVTATAAVALGYDVGETFQAKVVGAAPAAYTGPICATVTGAQSFTYPLETNPGAATAPGMFNMQFFAAARKSFQLNAMVAGPVESTGDQGTNTKLIAPDFFKNLTMEDLDLIKTPWGRRYLAFAMKAGPTVVGVS